MTVPAQENQVQDVRVSDKEMNFRNLERKLEQERQARIVAEERAIAAERAAQERARVSPLNEDYEEEEDSEPYVDKRKLKKELSRFGESTKKQTQQEIHRAVQEALDGERRNNYLKDNSDFNTIMNSENVQKFADKHPRLAENILRMPEGFERQKLVYENIKALGIDKPEQKGPSIQEKIDQNRRSPYYQPSGVGTAPYAGGGDFSAGGQKNAYDQMQQLKARLRL